MKEATGELNMTVITVVAIAGVAALFTVFVWPMIQNTIRSRTICTYGAGVEIGTVGEDGHVKCNPLSEDGNSYTCSAQEGGKEYTNITCKVN